MGSLSRPLNYIFMATLVDLITLDDFLIQPYFIPIVNKNSIELSSQITKRQRELLIDLLGYNEYYNLENDNAGAFPTTEKWINFIDGVVYTKDGNTLDYKGVKDAIQRYVYYWFSRNNKLQASGFGGMKPDFKNATSLLEGNKMVDAWNEMVEMIGFEDDRYKNSIIGNFLCETDESPTIYNYLNDHDFDAKMKKFNTINNIL